MNIEVEKKRYPIYALRRWTHSTIHCYEQGCRCQKCIYNKAFESQKCKGKIAVLLLIEKIGKPKLSQIEKYYEIERELEQNAFY